MAEGPPCVRSPASNSPILFGRSGVALTASRTLTVSINASLGPLNGGMACSMRGELRRIAYPWLDRPNISSRNCPVSMGPESVKPWMPRSWLVSESDSREYTPFSTSTGANLNCSKALSALPPIMILVSLTSITRPANTRLASLKAGSRSKPRNHSSCEKQFAAPATNKTTRSLFMNPSSVQFGDWLRISARPYVLS